MPFDFPKEKNGYIDNGRPESSQKCWNCMSSRYKQTVSTESCPDCGIECDYWGAGANQAYEQASIRRNQNLERAQERANEEQEQAEERRRIESGYYD